MNSLFFSLIDTYKHIFMPFRIICDIPSTKCNTLNTSLRHFVIHLPVDLGTITLDAHRKYTAEREEINRRKVAYCRRTVTIKRPN